MKLGIHLAAILLSAFLPWAANAEEAPDALITGTMVALQEAIESQREELEQSPDKLRGVVDKVLLPRFDTDFAAQRVLGKHWRTASPSQRQRFINVFYRYLVNNYASYLLDFTGEEIQVSPYQGHPDDKYPLVKTQVKLKKGETAAVDYVLRRVDEQWKVIDVIVEGVSYVRSYREEFSAEIAQKGLDAVIERLETTTPELEVHRA